MGHVAAAFYGSGFDTAAAIIIDGSGSRCKLDWNRSEEGIEAYETESIYQCSFPGEFEPVFKRYAENHAPRVIESDREIDGTVTTVKAYEAVSMYLGFGFIEAGKTMGLAPYGKKDSKIPKLFYKDTGRGDKNVFMPQYPAGAWIDTERFDYLKIKIDPSSWHKDPSLLSNTQKNLAWAVQNETQEYIAELIEKAVDMTGEKNIVISGGYGLNVIANYYYRERFPELNIYVDPISHDGGTSIGYAKLFANKKIGDDNGEHIKDPLTTLYLGPKYDIRSEDIDDLVDDTMEVTDVTDVDVAQLIKDRNIVSIFQGRSEAGPRALGNRSIVYDPTDPDGKAKVNTVKGREWFRPFAGSIMKEHAKEWFDLRGLDETPYMMYAMEMQPEKIGELPSVTHVDGTCRIQTVSQEQNENYYNLINEFYKLSGVPLLFNTSFNLGGQPLVETIFDAIHTLKNSQLEYLYLPELGKLIKLSNEK
jgi:carbamoyltransferase